MYKIYSRTRIRIPKLSIKRIKSTKANRMTMLIVILLIAFFFAMLILKAILPIFDNLCESKAESVATIVSNEQATVVMREHTYDELYTIEKDEQGNITMIKSNIISINEIISDIANKIQEEINKKGRENVEIPLRQFYRI